MRLASATAGTPKGRCSDLRRTNGMLFSEAYETENSTASAGSNHALSCSWRLSIKAAGEGPQGPPLRVSDGGHLGLARPAQTPGGWVRQLASQGATRPLPGRRRGERGHRGGRQVVVVPSFTCWRLC